MIRTTTIRLRCDRRVHAELAGAIDGHRSPEPIIDRVCRDCSRDAGRATGDRYEVHHRWGSISGRRLKDVRYRLVRVLS